MIVKKQFLVYGRVQGVGFRFFTCREAQKIGLTGSVRNLNDGSVQVIAVGSAAQIEQLSQWLQIGPRTAKVERLLVQEYKATQEFTDFSITH